MLYKIIYLFTKHTALQQIKNGFMSNEDKESEIKIYYFQTNLQHFVIPLYFVI